MNWGGIALIVFLAAWGLSNLYSSESSRDRYETEEEEEENLWI